MKLRSLVLSVFFILVFSALSVTVFAHEGREVGDYEIHFGWRNEPAYAGLFNGPEVYISLHDAAEDEAFPADVEVALQAEVTFGPETIIVTFEPAWGETGHYIADLIPTLPGDYAFRVFGTIGDTEVNETFDSADGGFSPIQPSTDIMFPAAGSTDVAALLARIEALEARVTELEGN